MHAVETRGLAKAYGGRAVVEDFSITVNQGDIYGFVGKNGAGKSTVLKMIAGLTTPTQGEVLLFDGPSDPPRPQPDPHARIGALIETAGLIELMPAYDNLMAKALACGIPDAKERCEEMLRLMGLEGTGKKKAKDFSLGMKQRLGLGLALLGTPDLLLLDEPFNGLDPEGTRAMRTLLMRLNQSFGITMIISSHVLDQLDRMATRFGVIANGRLIRQMTAGQVREECRASLRIRTDNEPRTLALLQESHPDVAIRVEADRSLLVTGAYDASAIAEAIQAAGATVYEFSECQRDIEEYFVELMEGGAGHVQSA